MANVDISVRVVQRGLIGGRVSPSPGPADGKWGPRTHESLRSYVAAAAPGMGLDPARVLAPLRLLTYYDSARNVIGARTLSLPNEIASHLERMAAQYDEVARPGPALDTTTPSELTTSQGAPLWPWVLGGSVLLAGLGYWLYRRMR